MIEVPWLDAVGWAGALCLWAFYWLLGSGKVVEAYVFSLISSVFWMVIGVAMVMGYAAHMTSLIALEVVIVSFNIRGIYKWMKKNGNKTVN